MKYKILSCLLILILVFAAFPADAKQGQIPPGQHNKEDFVHSVGNGHGLDIKTKDAADTMYAFQTPNGKIHIVDNHHNKRTIQIAWSDLEALEGFNGQQVLITHINDFGLVDDKWTQPVINDGGYAYLPDVDFSEVIVEGFVGIYQKVGNNQTADESLSLGQTFDSDIVSYVNVSITPAITGKTDPYDIPTDGLVGWWRFDEGSGTLVQDYSGNGNNGTANSMTWKNGRYNSCGNFDGVDDRVLISDSDSIDGQIGTYGGWVYFTPNEGYQVLLSKQYNEYGNSARNPIYRLSTNDNGIEFRLGTGELTGVSTVTYNLDDGWNFIVATYDGVDVNLYVNTYFVDTDSHTTNINSSQDLYIGALYSPLEAPNYRYYTNKTFDDLFKYNRTLSQEEINQLYYIELEQLTAKVNSNATLSSEWNSASDNPLSVPYGAGESINAIQFTVPASVTQNGVTIYDYSSNAVFAATAEVGYTEDTTLISEELTSEKYELYIQHIPGNNETEGSITYQADANPIIDSAFLSTTLESNNPAAGVSFNTNTNTFTISTNGLTAGETYNYKVTCVEEGTVVDGEYDEGFGNDQLEVYEASGNSSTMIASVHYADLKKYDKFGDPSVFYKTGLGILSISVMIVLLGRAFMTMREFK